jgi:hypothetical protein
LLGVSEAGAATLQTPRLRAMATFAIFRASSLGQVEKLFAPSRIRAYRDLRRFHQQKA